MFGCIGIEVAIGVLQLILAVAAFVVALRQWVKSCETTRVEHLREMLCLFSDECIASGFCDLIDRVGADGKPVVFYDTNNCGMPKFASKEYEQTIDKMLLVFSSICHEHALLVIKDDEFLFFSYQIHRTLENGQIVNYLTDLVKFTTDNEKQFPFLPLLREGISVLPNVYTGLLREVENAGRSNRR